MIAGQCLDFPSPISTKYVQESPGNSSLDTRPPEPTIKPAGSGLWDQNNTSEPMQERNRTPGFGVVDTGGHGRILPLRHASP